MTRRPAFLVQLACLSLAAAAQAACERAANPREPAADESLPPPTITKPRTEPDTAVEQSEPPANPVTASARSLIYRDSGGVRIIEPLAPLWTAEDSWRLDSRNFVQIGVVTGDPVQEFIYIEDGSIDREGRVALADRGREVRVFSGAGLHQYTFGRKGNGPGEFRGAGTGPGMALTFASSDTLVVTDGRRIAWFASGGSLLREITVRIPDPRLAASNWQVAADGSLLLIGSTPIGKHAGDSWIYLVRETNGEVTITPIADYHDIPGIQIAGGGGVPGMRLTQPFSQTAPAAEVKASPVRAFVAHPTRWEIRTHKPDGSVESIIRLPIRRIAVTRDAIAAAREQFRIRRKNHPLLPRLLSEFDNLSYPDSMPAIRGMHWDKAGYLWIEHYAPDFDFGRAERKYEVLRGDSVWLGSVAVPPDVSAIWQIESGRIVTSKIDADGVHFARIYTFAPRRGPRPRE